MGTQRGPGLVSPAVYSPVVENFDFGDLFPSKSGVHF